MWISIANYFFHFMYTSDRGVLMASQTLSFGAVSGTVLGQTMRECKVHGWTSFVFVKGNPKMECGKCVYEKKLREEMD